MDDEMFVVLGDTITEYDVKHVLDSPTSMLGVKKVDDPREFGVAEMDSDGMVTHVVEKPSYPKIEYGAVGIIKLKNRTWCLIALRGKYFAGTSNPWRV